MNYFKIGETVHMAVRAQDAAFCGVSRAGAVTSTRALRKNGSTLCKECVKAIRQEAKGAPLGAKRVTP